MEKEGFFEVTQITLSVGSLAIEDKGTLNTPVMKKLFKNFCPSPRSFPPSFVGFSALFGNKKKIKGFITVELLGLLLGLLSYHMTFEQD